MKQRKSQLQIQEMAFVLVGLILFFALLMLFFAVFQQAKIKSLAEQVRREETVAKLHTIINMPEFSCREAFCIDEEKLIAFSQIDKLKIEKYQQKFDKANIVLIKVERVWPLQPGQTQTQCDNSNRPPNCGYHVIYNNTAGKNYEGHSTFVPMCYHSDGLRCDVGKIVVAFELPK